MDLSLTGTVVAVSGGTSGIGLATTELLTQEGATVIVLARGTTNVQLSEGAELIKPTSLLHKPRPKSLTPSGGGTVGLTDWSITPPR